MNIFVCVKQVVSRDSVLRLREGGKWIRDDGLAFEMNEPDTYALEEALRLKEKHGGQVVAVGTVEELENAEESLTGQYLSGRKQVPTPETRRAPG